MDIVFVQSKAEHWNRRGSTSCKIASLKEQAGQQKRLRVMTRMLGIHLKKNVFKDLKWYSFFEEIHDCYCIKRKCTILPYTWIQSVHPGLVQYWSIYRTGPVDSLWCVCCDVVIIFPFLSFQVIAVQCLLKSGLDSIWLKTEHFFFFCQAIDITRRLRLAYANLSKRQLRLIFIQPVRASPQTPQAEYVILICQLTEWHS